MLTLPSMLQRTLRLFGNNIAIRDAAGDLTWSRYIEGIARAAGMLKDLGIRPGERYATLCRNSVRHAELIHAGYWLGAVPVPINYRLAPSEIAPLLKHAECRLLAVEDVFAKLIDAPALAEWKSRAICIADAASASDLPRYDELKAAATAVDAYEPAEDDDAILLYTGGTTGMGKGVRISHRNITCNALQIARTMAVSEQDVYLHTAAMFHSTDLKSTVCSMTGAGHAYLSDFSPSLVLAAIARHGVTIASLVPTMIIRILQEADFHRYDLSSLRLISYGTSPMAPEWIRRAMTAFPGVAMHQVYGLTETVPVLSILDEVDHARALKNGGEVLRSAGRPLPGVDIRIIDDEGKEAPLGESGEIAVRGPQIAKGYLNMPTETAAAFRNGWFYTGDIGRLDAEGYLYVLDRKKDMVVTGGENVYTSEVEAVLYKHPAVSEAAVFGVPDETYGEALFAAIVAAEGRQPSVEELIAHCRTMIGGYKIPRRMAFVDTLPRSAMGKVLKKELRRIYAEQEYAKPINATMETVKPALRKVG